MIKRLIFDVDGTLITGVNFKDPIQKTLKQLHCYSEENELKFLKAIAAYETCYKSYNEKNYLEHFSNVLEMKLDYQFLQIFFENLADCIPPKNDQLINTIQELSEHYELVLLTNYFKKSQMNRLNAMKIGKYFKECFGEDLIKPNKEAFIAACGNYLPSECIMIGDHEKLDMEGGKVLDSIQYWFAPITMQLYHL